MCEDSLAGLPREDSTDVIRRFAAGEVDLIGQLQHDFHGQMTGAANRLFRRYRLDRAVDSETGLVGEALVALCQDARKGKLAWLGTADEFMRAFHRALRSPPRTDATMSHVASAEIANGAGCFTSARRPRRRWVGRGRIPALSARTWTLTGFNRTCLIRGRRRGRFSITRP